jgi:high-affinity iron transporter
MRRTWLLAALSLLCCERDVPAAYRSVPVPAARLADPAARERGRALFARFCALCHGGAATAAASAAPGSRRRPATSLLEVAGATSPLRLFATLREGVPMPSWAALSEDDAWDLVAYLRSLPAREEGGAAGTR